MNNDSESTIVPYRTESGLMIGSKYQPPKIYGSGEDILDLGDSYLIQSALIADNEHYRRERLTDIIFINVIIAFALAMTFFI